MDLSWSTFLLEIINFVVLVWLLKHFFYKPLQDVIARRQAGIEQRLDEARALDQQARALQQQYENRLGDWDNERQSAREALQQELNAERGRLEAELQASLAQEREKAEVILHRRRDELRAQLEQQALQQGGRFASMLLAYGAGPELEARLVKLLMQSLPDLPPERLKVLRERVADNDEPVTVTSAFPLPDGQRDRIQRCLQQFLQKTVSCEFAEDPQLVAGLRISIGPWMLRGNLQDELKGFTDFVHEPG